MRFVKNIYAALILMVTLCCFGSCDDKDESTLSEAVLAGASTLNFEGKGTAGQMITVYADADWVAEVPEWITVSPASGSGVTDVIISVSDNMRGGALDNPRKAAIVFKGRTLASRSEVLIIQAGDKYRDVKDYTVGELAALKNEAVVSVPNITVMAITTTGFVATDGQKTGNVFVLNKTTEKVNVGDKVSIMGAKLTDAQSLAYIESDVLETISTGGTVTYPAAIDITGQVDTYKPNSREFILVRGILNGNNISVEGASNMVNITDALESMNLASLNGHRVTVKGYFAGVAAPVVKIMVAEIQDDGLARTIYFSEDFEWLQPWAAISNAGQTVETDNPSATAPQIVTPVVDGVSALDAFLGKGYEFLRVTTSTPGECIYIQRNYLKFGKTSYQAGIVLPKLQNIPSDVTTELSFDWCPMRQGSGTIDPVNLIIVVANGGNEVTFDVPESGFGKDHKLEWIKVKVQLTGVAITKDTKITIRQTQWPAATANRWLLDNIEISKVD